MAVIAAALAGAASWSAAEYGLHRFLMHEMRGRGLASKEHLAHHADVTYFSPNSKKALSAASSTAVALPATWALFGRRNALAFSAGMVSAYVGYEVVHRRIHTHPPRNAYGRSIRRGHLHHHFGKPMGNYGVTSSLWDRLLGSYDDQPVLTVPRRMAPVWLLDEDGEVRPQYAADYVVKGRKAAPTPEDDERDHRDAFANIAPTADA